MDGLSLLWKALPVMPTHINYWQLLPISQYSCYKGIMAYCAAHKTKWFIGIMVLLLDGNTEHRKVSFWRKKYLICIDS